MFPGGYLPTSYYPPSYFPKNGVGAAIVGGIQVGGRRRIFRHLVESEALKRERRGLVGRRMSYRTFVEAIEKMEVHAEIRRRQQLLTTAAYSVLLSEF